MVGVGAAAARARQTLIPSIPPAAVILAILSIWYGRRAIARVREQAEAAGMPAAELEEGGDGGESGEGSGAAEPKPLDGGLQPNSAPAAT